MKTLQSIAAKSVGQITEKVARRILSERSRRLKKIVKGILNFLLLENCVYRNMNMKSGVIFLRRKLKVEYSRLIQRAGFSYCCGKIQEAGSITAIKLIL